MPKTGTVYINVKTKNLKRFTWLMWLLNYRTEKAVKALEKLQAVKDKMDLTIPEIKIEPDNVEKQC